MDYTDGSKEAKLIQEILHLIEEAAFRRDGKPVGFMAEMIMKEIEEKGLANNDFTFLTVNPQFFDDYERALTDAKIPFLAADDIYGNKEIIIQTQNKSRVSDVDAMIKKASSDYTRSTYIKGFLENSKSLGREVFSLDLNEETANILAAKTFQHQLGFVTSYHEGKIYFDETASNSNIAEILLDTSISTIAETRLGRIKRANNISESIMVDKVLHAVENKDAPNNTRYFVNAFKNKEKYIKVDNGLVQVYEYTDKSPTLKKTYDVSTYKDKEAFQHAIATELGEIYNCRDYTESEFLDYRAKSTQALAEDRENYLLEQVAYIAAFENEDHPKVRDEDEYIITDLKSLRETQTLLAKKVLEEKDPAKKTELKKQQVELDEFITEKTSYEELKQHIHQELYLEGRRNLQLKNMSAEKRIQWQIDCVTHKLTYDDHKSVTDFMENVKKNNKELTREELTQSFTQISGSLQHVSHEQRQAMSESLSQVNTASNSNPNPPI